MGKMNNEYADQFNNWVKIDMPPAVGMLRRYKNSLVSYGLDFMPYNRIDSKIGIYCIEFVDRLTEAIRGSRIVWHESDRWITDQNLDNPLHHELLDFLQTYLTLIGPPEGPPNA